MKLSKYHKYQAPRVGLTPLELECGILQPGSVRFNGEVEELQNIYFEPSPGTEGQSDPFFLEN